ncbi:MAG: imidazoleglycerol-phosphate dehydratase HisB [Candidatus Melainabacteria bacterium]|jgi:imidazoleglycerol-phosphate dehydratase|nr:imidazoleglycerol-phosphate dehydratase HisB [Candidatus Melainabacteria bacterium]
MRKSSIKRKSKETAVTVEINLDGTGQGSIMTGVPFFDHMLDQFRKHAFIDLSVNTMGDYEIDDHHSVEDTGIVIGQAIKEALGERKGITRYASARVVMDEALISCDIDLGTRPYLVYDVPVNKERIKTFETELCVEFWRALVNNSGMVVHFHRITGTNSHHIIEASFKAFALAFDKAKTIDARIAGEIRTTKGII